ncbi:regulatory protein YcgZ [Siccibacter turicensis]|uniref:regulatory protein YcgZ n=1 Tax=Siccibacter turicensis TaxID=357233 RepID=UPI003F56F650
MPRYGYKPDTASDIARYFSKVVHLSSQETLGEVVVELLHEGKRLSRSAICAKLLYRLEMAGTPEQDAHYRELIGMMFQR